MATAVSAQAQPTWDEPCAIATSVEPAHAFVGQQLLYRARIFRRSEVEDSEWEQAPTFPGFRSEWLPGRPEDTVEEIAGKRYLVREEHRALFATRTGTVQLPPATLLCRLAKQASEEDQTLRVRTQPQPVQIVEPPLAEQPSDFGGLVGALTVRTQVDRKEVELGDSLRISVLMRGVGNLWHVDPPLRDLDEMPGIEVFRESTETDTEPGERLHVRRFYRIDVVPTAAGAIQIPKTRVAYLDPETLRYEVASSPAITVDVKPKRLAEAAPPAAAANPEIAREDEKTQLPGWALGLALLAILAVILRKRVREQAPFAHLDAEREAARAAGEKGDSRAEAASYARALRAAIEVSAPPLAGLEPASLRREAEALASQRPELGEAVELLEALDRGRYAAEADRPDLNRVEIVIGKLRKSAIRRPLKA